MTDAELAAQLAHEAGRLLLEVRASGQYEGKELGKAGDAAANVLLCQRLRHPQIAAKPRGTSAAALHRRREGRPAQVHDRDGSNETR